MTCFHLLFCLTFISCLSALPCSALDIPPVPAIGQDVVLQPELQLTAGRKLQALFHPLSSDQDPVSLRHTGRKDSYIRLPVKFSGSSAQRIGWDIPVRADWSNAEAVVFDLIAGKDQSVTGLHLYLRSGDGWYTANFGPDSATGWNTIELPKEIFRMEGSPAGWHQIDRIRFGLWRISEKQDGWYGLANFGSRKPSADAQDILVIRGDSSREKYHSESNSFQEFAGNILRTLKNCRFAAAMISDQEVTPQKLKKCRLAILPYNPHVPENTLHALEAFVRNGGRILGCFALPKEIDRLLGVTYEKKKWNRPYTSFSGFLSTAKALRGQPSFIPQESYYTTVPDGKNARILATWADAEGKDTKIPALLLVPGGAYISHVWLDGSGPERESLMEALVCELIPMDRTARLQEKLKTIGREDRRGNWQSLCRQVRSSGRNSALRSLTKAMRLHNQAAELLEENRWEEACPLVDEALANARKAFFQSRKRKRGEKRLVWCHNAFGISGWNWDRSIRHLKDCGFTGIVVNMCWGGIAFYDSRVLPAYPDLKKRGDQIDACLTACRKYGLDCHIWKVCFNMGSRFPEEFQQQMIREGRIQISRDGTVNRTWLCPSHPLNRQLEIDVMTELAEKYPGLAGVHFDYIRYSHSEVCFCPGCRSRFEAFLKQKLSAWPFDRKDRKLTDRWNEFRRSNINDVVENVHRNLRKIRTSLQISAAVFTNSPLDRNDVGQDWEFWCRKGWLDFVCPMNYRESDLTFLSLIQTQKQWNHKVRLYPGIGLSCWAQTDNPYRLVRQIELVRKEKLPGFIIFNYDRKAADTLQWLKYGCLRP